MKKALMLAPMGSVHRRFNKANIEALQSLGYAVELMANFEEGDGPEKHNPEFVDECKAKNIKTYSVPFERHSLFGSLKCVGEVKRICKKQKYDIIHAHTETGGFILRMCGKICRKKVFTPHGMSFYKGSSLKSQLIYKTIEKWICGGMDANLGMNFEEYDCLDTWNKYTAKFVHGVGLDLERFKRISEEEKQNIRKEFGVGDNEKLIVSVGELDDNKNHVVVLKALGALSRDSGLRALGLRALGSAESGKEMGWKYVICGVGPNRDMLINEAKRLGIGDKVILAGFRHDIPQILNSADLFVFPSRHEGMPVAVMEAMACKLPVICSRIRGNVDIVKDGMNGFLIHPDDSRTLAEKLAVVLNDDKLSLHMGIANHDQVGQYSYPVVVQELREIYGALG